MWSLQPSRVSLDRHRARTGRKWVVVPMGAGEVGGARATCVASHSLQVYKRMYLAQKASRETRHGETVLIPPSTEYWPYPLQPQVPGVIGQ